MFFGRAVFVLFCRVEHVDDLLLRTTVGSVLMAQTVKKDVLC